VFIWGPTIAFDFPIPGFILPPWTTPEPDMTRDVLQTDIDLAEELLLAGRPQSEIVAALVCRGILADVAARVTSDLRDVRLVTPASPWVAGRNEAWKRQLQGQPEEEAERSPGRGATFSVPWFSIVILGACAVSVVAFVMSDHHPEPTANEHRSQKGAPIAARLSAPDSLVLEIKQDGLRIGGRLISRENAFRTVSDVIGAPTRTNLIPGLDRVIYVYDRHGLLIYSQLNAGDDSVVLDFETIAGTNATRIPFTGTLKIDHTVIGASTTPGSLASFKELGLSQQGVDSGLFGGRYEGMEINFAYLTNTQHLSLVEINLR